jgi:RluA family pseudouridine synthase
MTATSDTPINGPGATPILFENGDVLAVCKPEGLAAIPERVKEKDSLLFSLQSVISEKLYVVHRLDKEASGVMLFAKNPDAHKCLNDQFAKREVAKTYLALIHGILQESCGTIDKPIRPFGSGRMGVDAKRGKPSTTSYEVVRHVKQYTLLNAHASTGRRHQIRVHFYSVGHPIVGDRRYGERELQERFPRLMLHASAISFRLPTGESITVESSVPESFAAVLAGVSRSRHLGNGPRASD